MTCTLVLSCQSTSRNKALSYSTGLPLIKVSDTNIHAVLGQGDRKICISASWHNNLIFFFIQCTGNLLYLPFEGLGNQNLMH